MTAPHARTVLGPTLRTSRLEIRPLGAGDRRTFIEAIEAGRAELDRWSPLRRDGESDDAVFARHLDWAGLARDGSRLRLVAAMHDGTIVGGANLQPITRDMELAADCTWWVRTDLCGRGLGREIVEAMIAHALAPPPGGQGLHLLRAWITPDNERSLALAQRVGFRRAGTETSRLPIGSAWVAHDLYTLALTERA